MHGWASHPWHSQFGYGRPVGMDGFSTGLSSVRMHGWASHPWHQCTQTDTVETRLSSHRVPLAAAGLDVDSSKGSYGGRPVLSTANSRLPSTGLPPNDAYSYRIVKPGGCQWHRSDGW